MPLIQSIKRINPLDLNKNVKVGIPFPLTGDNVLFNSTATTKEQVKSNLINLLLTKQGERIGEVNFGVGLQNLLFEQNIDLENLKEKIKTQINIYVPQISLLDAQTNFVENEQTLYIIISYRFNLDGTQDTIQLNFE
jgi:phage baseplate assembly protein W|tara:strand:+ start:68 stop:478 length:411 start_codon:yes stop_codon:yes gene_type:complete